MDRAPPVKEGEIVELTIDSVGAKGDGIARKQGFVIFIPNTSKGDFVKVKITKVLPKAGFGELVTKLKGEAPKNKEVFVKREPRITEKSFEAHEELDSEEF